jgi:hypothetical protein
MLSGSHGEEEPFSLGLGPSQVVQTPRRAACFLNLITVLLLNEGVNKKSNTEKARAPGYGQCTVSHVSSDR